MIISEVVTLGMYAFSMIFLPEYFGAFVFNIRPAPHFRFVINMLNSRRRSAHSLFQIYHLSSQCGLDGKSQSSLQ